MITWLEEAYRIDESYEAICQILAANGDGCTCTPNLYEKLHSLAYVAKGGVAGRAFQRGAFEPSRTLIQLLPTILRRLVCCAQHI
jgi:hypothetical protein